MTKPVAGIMLVCALALGLSACGSDDEPKTTTSVKASPSAESTASTEPETEESVAPEGDEASQRAALDVYVEAERAALESADAEMLAVYSDITVEGIDPGTVAFGYTFAEQIDAAAAAAEFDAMAPQLQDVCDNQVFPAMESVGVTDSPKVTYTYINADGTEIWSKTFEPA